MFIKHILPNTTTTQHGPSYLNHQESWQMIKNQGIVAEIVRDWHSGVMAYVVWKNGKAILAADTLDEAVNLCRVTT